MTIPVRISADETYRKVKTGRALLVCAYENDDKCRQNKLEGSIPYSQFRKMLAALPKTQEIVFYCA